MTPALPFKKWSWFSLLALLPGLLGWSQDWAAIRSTASQIHALRAEFVQRKELPILARPLISEGLFCFRRPHDLRWEYQQPLRSVLLLEGNRLERYLWRGGAPVADVSGQLEAMQVVVAELGLWLGGRFEESSNFVPTLRAGTPTVVELVPRSETLGKFIQRIELRLSATPGVIDEVRIIEGPQTVTTLEFRKVELLPSLPDELFRKP